MIDERKADHIRVCLEEDVRFRKDNGFARYELPHRALPEIDRGDVDLSTEFLGKRLKAPLIIEAMTGGFRGAETINANLAAAAERAGIAMGVGSQRAGLEDPSLAYTYKVRDVAPGILLLGNLGAAQVAQHGADWAVRAVEMIGADGLAIHLNPAQELVQGKGDVRWRGVLLGIRDVCASVGFPVVVKEVGNGISGEVARQLEDAGVAAVDVAGAGGCSWVRIEHHRNREPPGGLSEWGIPTAECLRQCRDAGVGIPLIASGGVRTGLDCAKAIAMGASLAGMALPLLKPATQSAASVEAALRRVVKDMEDAMFLAGAADVRALGKAGVRAP
jgi:isopentenyl-diphosphate delta-isomerase